MAHVSAAERRPQLIKAAIDLMAREGVAAGSTRAIAAELGVAQATVHYTFGTKEGLYRAVMEQLTEDLVAQVERAAPEDAGFEATVTALAAALWRTVGEQPTSYLLLNELSMFALRTPSLSEALRSHYGGIVDVTTKLVNEAAERTGHQLGQPAETLARFFLAGFDGLTMQHLSLPDEAGEHTALQALVSAVVALAGGRLDLVTVPTD
ncbi:TetR/AcrR family transcriptional regulator [Streptomyces sp. NRRL S-646]|uniref:TetR/AcrR family transcriptional regulator n=1 Tax=Streptomyces sp. NRRL S-646 TaxID=1463917 RepID=UPI0004CAB4EF|nr:TetR/AcrR family transcriptional regulator [Streptomyces sp. NRRL S-646]